MRGYQMTSFRQPSRSRRSTLLRRRESDVILACYWLKAKLGSEMKLHNHLSITRPCHVISDGLNLRQRVLSLHVLHSSKLKCIIWHRAPVPAPLSQVKHSCIFALPVKQICFEFLIGTKSPHLRRIYCSYSQVCIFLLTKRYSHVHFLHI